MKKNNNPCHNTGTTLKRNGDVLHTMKKQMFFIFLLILSVPGLLNAQENKVKFQYDKNGTFVRVDSEQPYYVFEYDSLYGKDMVSLFVKRFNELKCDPTRFTSEYRRSNMDQYGVITVYSTKVDLPSEEAINVTMQYQVRFKDNRLRIDSPKIIDISRITIAGNITPDLWVNSYFQHQIFKRKEIMQHKRDFISEYVNNTINELINYFECGNTDSWDNLRECTISLDSLYITYNNDFTFVMDDGKQYANYHIPGASAKMIRSALYSAFEKLRKQYKSFEDVMLSFTDNGLEISGTTNEFLMAYGVLPNITELYFRSYFAIADETIRIYVPYISKANIKDTEGFSRLLTLNAFLVKNQICDERGKVIDGQFRQRYIQHLEGMMSMYMYTPLYVVMESLQSMISADDTNW